MKSIKIVLYFTALAIVLIAGWVLKDTHLGWGYTVGMFGILSIYFVGISALRKSIDK